MKKILLILIPIFIITGCGNMEETPTRKVEAFFNQYQTLDKSVLNNLDTVLMNDTSLTDNERSDYRDFMKHHYQDLDYRILEEKIDGNEATVRVEVTVRSYARALSDTENYRALNQEEFNTEAGEHDTGLFSTYRLKELKKVTNTSSYIIDVTLTKVNDKWRIDELSDEDLNKINGLYAG